MRMIRNFCGHFRTITRHRHKVIIHCFKAGIGFQGLFHDLSKYMPDELCESVKYYQDGKRSPNEGARQEQGYSLAWMHHKGRNKHHFEYWTDYSPETKLMEPMKMPVKYVAEMICDRVAASKIYGGRQYTDRSPLDYFLKGKARRKMHPETSELTERLLTMLAEEGEDALFAYLKKILKENKNA